MNFLTSWDDGHPLDERVAELLARHGLQGTFFVPARNREGREVLGDAALRRLDAAFEVGSHTADHAYLDGVGLPEAREQVQRGKALLEQALGHAVAGFCYPGGRWSCPLRQLVKDAGFHYARTIAGFQADAPRDAWAVGVTAQLYPHRRRALLRNFVRGGRHAARLPLLSAALGTRDLDARLVRMLDLVERGGGTFHLWGHSWELEERGLWGALGRFLAEVAGRRPRALRLEAFVREGQGA